MKAKSCQILLLFLLLLVYSIPSHADTNIINIYDANGNLVTGDGHYYEYNDANQLVKVRQGDQNGAVVAEYFYDYTGQRVKKVENGVTTYYVSPHFEKQVGGAEAGDSKYYFSNGERVAKKDPAGNVYYYHSDHLGGVNAVTDSAGTIVAKADYMPFGDVKQGGTGNEKYSYTGKEKDKTDLYYFESRYNSPMFRHFTQADTVAPDLSDPQDLNRYSYVGNNPLSYVDDDGHKKKKKSKKKKKKKKKAKLSKREKWMIAHGIDPDKDKTSLKKAKKKYKEKQKKESSNNILASSPNFISTGEDVLPVITNQSSDKAKKARIIASLTMVAAYQAEAAAWEEAQVNILEGTYNAINAFGSLLIGDVKGAFSGVFDMSSTLARITGKKKTSALFSLTSDVIDVSGYLSTGKNFNRALSDGRTKQARALLKEDINWFKNMSDEASGMLTGFTGLMSDTGRNYNE